MAKLKLTIELDYDDKMMHGDDEEAREWFFGIIKNDELYLVSEEMGDNIGTVKVIEIQETK